MVDPILRHSRDQKHLKIPIFKGSQNEGNLKGEFERGILKGILGGVFKAFACRKMGSRTCIRLYPIIIIQPPIRKSLVNRLVQPLRRRLGHRILVQKVADLVT